MNFVVSTVVLVTLTLFLLSLMLRSWRRRNERDAHVASNDPLTGNVIASFDRVFYVATTPADAPLERVAAPGLQYRGWSALRVLTDGVEVRVTGSPVVRIPRDAVRAQAGAQLTIDKVVERDGLAAVEWNFGERRLVSTFRFRSRQDHDAFARSIDEMLGKDAGSTPAHHTKETP